MEQVSKENASKCLKRALDRADQMRGLENSDSEFQVWRTSTMQDLKRIFGNQSDCHKDFDRSLIIFRYESAGTNLDRATALLKSKIEEIEDDWPETAQASDNSNANYDALRKNNKVFVVHGHDDAARETVARFLERLDLEPVILHEQPNMGRTIIEKFEDHSDVGFAVVLLTPDDVGAVRDRPHNLKPRARQNVVFELGYFAGVLGREKVCALAKGDIEIPSDYDGVVYIPLDDGNGWRMKLVQELKAADFDVDANKAI